jgi:dipeptidyl aminopeptidase/acylaminoacyl peptidase
MRVVVPAVVLGLLLVPGPAQAAFPGQNGKIAFSRGTSIWTVNPDGSGRTQITSGGYDFGPRWSPDGRQITFTSTRADANPFTCTSCRYEVFVVDADGSDLRRVTYTTLGYSHGASWSPDGTQLAFARNRHIWTINADGTDERQITPDRTDPECFDEYGAPIWSPDGTGFANNGHALCYDHEYPTSCVVNLAGLSTWCSYTTGADHVEDWSPDSHSLVFGTMGIESGMGLYTVRLDDGSFNQLTDTTHDNGDGGATWSPDGRHIAFARATSYEWDPLLFIMDAADGSNLTQLSTGDAFECCPDWQSIPINGYPRPKGTYPLELSLVPAYEPCTAPNRTHGPPLAFPSCAPPQRSPGQLTVGTADSNQRPTKSVSIVRLRALPGIPSTPADEADIALSGTVNDVRLASDLSDYTGTLEARMSLRITDKDNTPHPGGPGAATVQDITYSFPIPCSATADTTIGGDCAFDTTAEAFVPGIAKELRRSIWELGALRVHDGAGNLFLTQGIFVP